MRSKRIIRPILFGILLLLAAWTIRSEGAGIYNNSGTSGGDSISVGFYALDSTGNVVAMASGDSVFFYTFFPDGSIASEDSAAHNGAKITAKTRHGFTIYSWKDAVADIDGGTATEGVYSYLLIVKDNTGAALETAHRGSFQVYAGADFDAVLDTTRLSYDSLLVILDSLNAVIDSLNNSATVAEIMDSILGIAVADTTDGSVTPRILSQLIDQLDAVLDTLQDGPNGPDVNATATISNADMAAIADSVHQADTLGHNNIAGSFGQVLSDPNYIQGPGNTLSAKEVADTLFERLVSDTIQGTYLSQIARQLQAVLDSLDLYDPRWDSLLAALADLNINDKVWLDGTPTVRAEISDILDSMEQQDNWVAKEATVNGIDDDPWDNPTRTLTTADWTTDADITQLKTDLANNHGSGSWETASGFATASQLYALAIISGYDLGTRSITRYHQTVDTTFVYDETTLKAHIIGWHVNGEAGDFPDSTRVDSVGTW